MYHCSKKYNILPQNGLISRLGSDGRVYSVYVIAKGCDERTNAIRLHMRLGRFGTV